ncbi:hypothetical protein [Prevotella fusca]|uniref:Uncharacterized protein n=2 Tax=Prevotella fusca JCM 17724 TaxID=1236517 RepID=A0A0K1NHX4_9BACT|nr:hypothetical protein [Prevotella fusca]AKU68620.1 hypothetical protein ADJ77_01885 [Prevotella fusca JCM 17724]
MNGKNMKTVDYVKIESLYNTRLSIQENLEQLKAKGIEVGRASLYNYCKDKGISDRLGDDELKHLINPMQTVRQNLDLLKGKGYKISKDRICKVLKESSLSKTMNDKNTYLPSEYEKEAKTELQSTPKPTLNDIVGLDKFLSSLTPNINEDLENKDKVEGEDLEKKDKPVVEEVKPTKLEDTNPLCNLKFDFAKLMGDF